MQIFWALIVDVDECKTVYPCSHFCINTFGSYRCECAKGFHLVDGKNCQVTGCKWHYSFNFLSSKHVILIGLHVLFLFIKRVLFLAYPDLSCILRIIMVEFQRWSLIWFWPMGFICETSASLATSLWCLMTLTMQWLLTLTTKRRWFTGQRSLTQWAKSAAWIWLITKCP